MEPTYHDRAERGCLRLFYRDWHPTRLGKFASWALAWMSGAGLTPPILVTLQVKGRRSGRLHNTVLVVTEHEGRQYLVSMLGDGSDWVRNVRAAGGKAFVRRGQSHPVQLTEIPASERGPILKAYCQVATSGREHFPVRHDAPISDFDAVAARYPCFPHRSGVADHIFQEGTGPGFCVWWDGKSRVGARLFGIGCG